MPRIKDSVKKQVEQAEKAARKAVFHPKKQKRQKRVHSDSEESKPRVQTYWVKDEWGRQGEVFFDGFHYWGVALKPPDRDGLRAVVPICWTPEEWEKRKKGEVKKNDASESGRGSVERGNVGGSLGNHKRTTRKSGKRQRPTHRKTRTRKSVSGGKRPKVAKGQRKVRKDVQKTRKKPVATKTPKSPSKKSQVKAKKTTKKTRKTRTKKTGK